MGVVFTSRPGWRPCTQSASSRSTSSLLDAVTVFTMRMTLHLAPAIAVSKWRLEQPTNTPKKKALRLGEEDSDIWRLVICCAALARQNGNLVYPQ